MIEINLLPESLREVEHTPWPRLITILVGVIVFFTASYFAATEYFYVITDLNDKIASAEAFEKNPNTINAIKRVTALKAEIEEKRKRKDILVAIVSSKIMWCKKLDEFNQLVDEKFHETLWFDNIAITSTQKIDFSKSNTPIIMKMVAKGHLIIKKEDSVGAVSYLQTQLKTSGNAFGANIDPTKFKIASYTNAENKEINKNIVDFPLEITFLPKTFLSTEVTPKSTK